MKVLSLVVVAGCAAPPTPAPPRPPTDADAAVLARLWPDGCFAIREADGRLLENDHARCAAPRRPYSTFKLANALIAVDAGVLDGPDAAMTWDRERIPDDPDWPEVWREPHTLRTGIAVSAVPYFRTLALELGEERMRAGLAKLAYGNQDITPRLDVFWLSGGLRITAEEELGFVDALAHGRLAVSEHAQATVREVSILAREGGRVLHGKTGSGSAEDGRPVWLVWQVGYVERDGAVLPYAGWMEVAKEVDLDTARDRRTQRVNATLDALGWFTMAR